MTSESVAGAEPPGGTGSSALLCLGRRVEGTTRRRASDAFRLGFAVVVVAVSVPVMRANSAVELSVVLALNPPPAGISWLVTSVLLLARFWGLQPGGQ